MERVLVIKTCLPNFTASSTEGEFVMRTCLGNSSVSSVEAVLVMKNVSLKLVLLHLKEGVLVIKNVTCQTLQLLFWRDYWWSRTWRVYWWSRTCLSNSSASLMEVVLENVPVKLSANLKVIKNVSVKLFSFFNGGRICDEERVLETLQFLQWRQYWWSRTCLSNSSASLMEGVLVLSVKLFSFFFGWSRTCLSNCQMDGVLMIKNVFKIFSFINGGGIGDEERACQTLLLI